MIAKFLFWFLRFHIFKSLIVGFFEEKAEIIGLISVSIWGIVPIITA